MNDANALAERFQALSDPTRIQVLELLSGGERCVCELTAALDAAQSRLSFHLKTLKTAGLISGRQEGRWVYYSIEPGVPGELRKFLSQVQPEEGDRMRPVVAGAARAVEAAAEAAATSTSTGSASECCCCA